MTTTARLVSHSDLADAGIARIAYTAREAADMLGVSEATVRAACRRLGVTRISGPSCAGFIQWDKRPVAVRLTVHIVAQ